MTSTLSAQIWYPWPLILDREKNISDRDVIKKIIRMTIPKKTVCKLLDVGCSNSGRLQEAVSHNALVEGTGLMQKTICHTDKKNTFKKNQKIELIPTELLQYRAAPSFDLIYLFEWLARIPADKQKSVLQYCRMLLKPGGRLVTAAGNNSDYPVHSEDIKTVMRAAGLYAIRTHRITGIWQLVTAQRPVLKNV